MTNNFDKNTALTSYICSGITHVYKNYLYQYITEATVSNSSNGNMGYIIGGQRQNMRLRPTLPR